MSVMSPTLMINETLPGFVLGRERILEMRSPIILTNYLLLYFISGCSISVEVFLLYKLIILRWILFYIPITVYLLYIPITGTNCHV